MNWRADLLRPHGTTAAYRRHYRHGEKPCRACADEHNQRQKLRARARRAERRQACADA